jgi:hypothetical protein
MKIYLQTLRCLPVLRAPGRCVTDAAGKFRDKTVTLPVSHTPLQQFVTQPLAGTRVYLIGNFAAQHTGNLAIYQ